MYNNYYIVVRISELMFSWIVEYLEDWVLVLDSIYVMFCLMFYVCFGYIFYEMYLKDDLMLCFK